MRAAGLFAAVMALDQGTKALVTSYLDRGERDPVLPGVELVNVRNKGVAFGIDAGGGEVVIAVTLTALLLLLAYFALHAGLPLIWVPTGLLLGGALGNLLDRARLGAVVDFVDLPLWPAFNVADTAIVLGLLSFLYVLERGREEATPAGAPGGDS